MAISVGLSGCTPDQGSKTVAPADTPAAASASTASPPNATASAQPGASIGVATMAPDGTIVLQLRAEGPGAIGDAQLTYPPSHKDYKEVLDHLGGLRPGESKPVPPWPDAP